MVGSRESAVGRDVQALFQVGSLGGLTDRELLERFVTRQDGWAEPAFALLVERHGPLVWGVCRRILNNSHDAADAFQATFLILVRRADALQLNDSLGGWLYGVSRRVALRAKQGAARRSSREVGDVESLAIAERGDDAAELLAHLDEEIGRLPERYRAVVVLCDLQGLRHEDAARQLGCAVGTVGSRLTRGRQQLRARLARRGLVPAAGMAAAVLTPETGVAAPPVLVVRSTAQSAVCVAAKAAPFAEVVSASVALLVEGAMTSMIATKLQLGAMAAFTTVLVVGATAVHALQTPGADGAAPPAARDPAQAEARTKKERALGLTAQPAAGLSDPLRDELDWLTVQLAKRKGAVDKSKARYHEALATVEAHTRLNLRSPGVVSTEELKKVEIEVMVATAEVQLAEAGYREIEVLIEQANRAKNDPQRLNEYFARSYIRGRDTSALEKRVGRLEEKLDQLLNAMESRRGDAEAKP